VFGSQGDHISEQCAPIVRVARREESHTSAIEAACTDNRWSLTMKKYFVDFLRDEDGLTATEYAVVGALLVAGLIVAFTVLGGAIQTRITEIANTITTGAP
jgi:pilus assembly protein Flp/PilA